MYSYLYLYVWLYLLVLSALWRVSIRCVDSLLLPSCSWANKQVGPHVHMEGYLVDASAVFALFHSILLPLLLSKKTWSLKLVPPLGSFKRIFRIFIWFMIELMFWTNFIATSCPVHHVAVSSWANIHSVPIFSEGGHWRSPRLQNTKYPPFAPPHCWTSKHVVSSLAEYWFTEGHNALQWFNIQILEAPWGPYQQTNIKLGLSSNLKN